MSGSRRDPRSEPGDVPEAEVLGRASGPVAKSPGPDAPVPLSSLFETPARSPAPTLPEMPVPDSASLREGLPPVLAVGSLAPSAPRPSTPPSEEDLLADLAAKVLLEERMRRAAEQRCEELKSELARTEQERDRTIGELRATIEGLRQELLALEHSRATERRAAELELERVRAESAAELATLRARRVPSVRTAVLREEAQQVADELAMVRRTADEALGALRRLVERKESALEEGRAALERIRPGIVQQVLSRNTPGQGVPVSRPTPVANVTSDYPEVRVDEDDG